MALNPNTFNEMNEMHGNMIRYGFLSKHNCFKSRAMHTLLSTCDYFDKLLNSFSEVFYVDIYSQSFWLHRSFKLKEHVN